jgi:hypothetical protein
MHCVANLVHSSLLDEIGELYPMKKTLAFLTEH